MLRWQNDVGVFCGVAAGLFLALWFSNVVAMGPAPGKREPPRKAENGQAQQPAADPNPFATNQQDQRPPAQDETHCPNPQTRTDCLIQLRTAQATEAQARYSRYGLWLVGATILLTGIAAMAAIGSMYYGRKAADAAAAAVVAGNRSADAATRSADAVVSVERAHFFVRVHAQSVQDLISQAAMVEAEHDGADIEPKVSVTYKIRNFGKTPGILREITHRLVPLIDLPDEPFYSDPAGLPYETVLVEGAETPQIDCTADECLSVRQAKDIQAGKCSMWFIGRIVYEDIVTSALHIEPYLYRYSGAGFDPDYREAYNKRS